MMQGAPARDRAVKRSITWIAAYQAQETGAYEEAASLYDQVAVMHDEAEMPIKAAHYREMAAIMRTQVNTALEDSTKT
jgi:hypothetical protein